MIELAPIRDLQRRGRFSEALALLDAGSPRRGSLDADVLRAELLERTGNYPDSERLARRLLTLRQLPPQGRSVCEFSLGMIGWDAGRTSDAIDHLQRAVALAEQCGDTERVCWAQLRLMVAVGSIAGSVGSAPLLARLRANVTRLGEPTVSAALHILVGEMECKQGLFANAQRHTRLGQRLLAALGNPWLEAMAENTLAAIAILTSDFASALAHIENVRRLSLVSGSAAMHRASLGNLGNIHGSTGDFESAVRYLRQCTALLSSCGEYANAGWDGLARALLAQGRLDEALEVIAAVDQSINAPADRVLFGHRYFLLTKTELLMRLDRWHEAERHIDETLELAERADDRLLFALALSRKAEIVAHTNTPDEGADVLDRLARLLYGQPPDVHASYERALGHIMQVAGRTADATAHFARARHVLRSVGIAPASAGLECALTDTQQPTTLRDSPGASTPCHSTLLHSVSLLLLHPERPELLARTLLSMIAGLDCASGASIVRCADECDEPIAAWGLADPNATTTTLAVGTNHQGAVEVRVRPRPDIGSRTTLHNLALIVDAVRDIARARAERAERATLWPLEEPLADGDPAVVQGEMARVMTTARKLAIVNVPVLITGESGTGKELVARAIHRHSSRAKKPFVQLNCTAVPRDLLESQVFGHRRGAFTGADRDNPGLIRGARDGTLFLDEIGDLGIDLQPKLLRFLESGEIHPLGENAPINVNVRVVAATNANLDQLVKSGRFREDLFYRLNVVAIEIPPLRARRDEIPALVQHFLASAASEFGKGSLRMSEEAMEHLLCYRWPGNVRQLQNEIRRLAAVADADALIEANALKPEIRSETNEAVKARHPHDIAIPLSDKLAPAIARLEREMISRALRAHRHVDAAARALGLSRKGLYLKRQRYNL